MKRYGAIALVSIAMAFTACVPSSKFEKLKQQTDEQIQDLKRDNHQLEVANNELESKSDRLKDDVSELKSDTASLGREIRRLRESHRQLEKMYEAQKKKNETRENRKSNEMKALLQELEVLQQELLEREDRLNALEDRLNEKEERLAKLEDNLESKQERLLQLETILQRQDSVVSALKDKVSEALYGFEGEGLTVEQKNGKVYLSLEEKLLFQSGSWSVGGRGREAITKIARLLEKNPDIHVMIEGHTDNVPYRGSGQVKDNWDLSVKRATSIVRVIINKSDVDPARLTAAGRSKYVPVDSSDTREARRKNRRTEIILTPDLSELFDIIGREN